MLHLPRGTETKDWKEVSRLLAHPSTFHRWWHRGDKSFRKDNQWDTQVDDDDYLMSLPPQSLLVVGKAPVSGPTPENIFDRLLTLLRESSGASSVYNEVPPSSYELWMDGSASKWLNTFVTGARLHGRGLPAEVGPDASQYKGRWWVDEGEDSSLHQVVNHHWHAAGLQSRRAPRLVRWPVNQCTHQGGIHEQELPGRMLVMDTPLNFPTPWKVNLENMMSWQQSPQNPYLKTLHRRPE